MEHQLPFVARLRAGPKMRKHMFDAIEQRATHDFWKGKVGIGIYEDLLSAVRDSGVSDSDADIAPREEMTNQHGTTRMQGRSLRGWAGIYALCLAAFVAAAVFGFKVVRKTAPETPVFETTITAALSTEPTWETMIKPAEAVAAEATIPDTKMAEPESETTTAPIPEISLEQIYRARIDDSAG